MEAEVDGEGRRDGRCWGGGVVGLLVGGVWVGVVMVVLVLVLGCWLVVGGLVVVLRGIGGDG